MFQKSSGPVCFSRAGKIYLHLSNVNYWLWRGSFIPTCQFAVLFAGPPPVLAIQSSLLVQKIPRIPIFDSGETRWIWSPLKARKKKKKKSFAAWRKNLLQMWPLHVFFEIGEARRLGIFCRDGRVGQQKKGVLANRNGFRFWGFIYFALIFWYFCSVQEKLGSWHIKSKARSLINNLCL